MPTNGGLNCPKHGGYIGRCDKCEIDRLEAELAEAKESLRVTNIAYCSAKAELVQARQTIDTMISQPSAVEFVAMRENKRLKDKVYQLQVKLHNKSVGYNAIKKERDEAKEYWGKFADQARHAITERDEMEDNYHAACRSKSRKEVRLQASLDTANRLLREWSEIRQVRMGGMDLEQRTAAHLAGQPVDLPPGMRERLITHLRETRAHFTTDVYTRTIDALIRDLERPVEGKPLELNKAAMPRVNGKSFRCECRCNVFTELKSDGPNKRYKCNSCGTTYVGQPKGSK